MDCYIFFARCNDFNFRISRTVIVYRPEITNRRIKCYKILNSTRITTANNIRRDVMSALAHSGSDTFDSLLGSRQPEIEQRYKVVFCLRPLYEFYIGPGCQCRFKGEILPTTDHPFVATSAVQLRLPRFRD